jgi:hypothetical protein
VRDYEMVELKLSVALEEGVAGRGLTPCPGKVVVERLMPGLYVLGVPLAGKCLSLVVMTDEYDLSLLGICAEKDRGVLLLHEHDVAALAQNRIQIDTADFVRREPMPGWLFRSFPWKDAKAADSMLQAMLPTYQPEMLGPDVFADC